LLHLLSVEQIGRLPLGTILVPVDLVRAIVLLVNYLGLFAFHLFLMQALLALAHKSVHLPIQVVIGSFEVVLVTRSLSLHLFEHPVDFVIESELLDCRVAAFPGKLFQGWIQFVLDGSDPELCLAE